MKARYVRVSTANQNTARQLRKSYPDEKIFIDVISGVVPFNERPFGKILLQEIETNKIDYLTVQSIDRLGRNLVDILMTIQRLDNRSITLKVDNLGIESLINKKPNPAFKLIISVLANIAEMERNTARAAMLQGVAIAKAHSKYTGRQKGSVESDELFLRKHNEVVKNLKKGTSIRDVAKICKVSPSTVQKVKNKSRLKANS